MPDGRTHTTASYTLAALTVCAAPVMFNVFGAAYFAIVPGALAGALLTPDHDVDGGNISMALVRRVFGDGASIAWRLFWWPYAKTVAHRSPVSHAPVVGTAVRLGYIAAGLFVLALLFRAVPRVVGLYAVLVGAAAFWWFVAGLALADALHAVMDWTL